MDTQLYQPFFGCLIYRLVGWLVGPPQNWFSRFFAPAHLSATNAAVFFFLRGKSQRDSAHLLYWWADCMSCFLYSLVTQINDLHWTNIIPWCICFTPMICRGLHVHCFSLFLMREHDLVFKNHHHTGLSSCIVHNSILDKNRR